MFALDGKTALVTGATGGIGGAIAKSLHGQGASVIISGTRENVLNDLASELGDRVSVVPANLGEAESVEFLAKEAEAKAENGVDILINNAGVTKDGLIMRMKDEDWDDVMRINLTSGFRLSRALVRGMMKRRWGRVIGISSVVGTTGNAGQTNYAASKAGMVGFTKAFALEVASRGITANVVAPGFIATPMTDALTDDQRSNILTNVPAGRLGSAEEIASAVVYLASEEAAYVNGQTLHVNGGMAMI